MMFGMMTLIMVIHPRPQSYHTAHITGGNSTELNKLDDFVVEKVAVFSISEKEGGDSESVIASSLFNPKRLPAYLSSDCCSLSYLFQCFSLNHLERSRISKTGVSQEQKICQSKHLKGRSVPRIGNVFGSHFLGELLVTSLDHTFLVSCW